MPAMATADQEPTAVARMGTMTRKPLPKIDARGVVVAPRMDLRDGCPIDCFRELFVAGVVFGNLLKLGAAITSGNTPAATRFGDSAGGLAIARCGRCDGEVVVKHFFLAVPVRLGRHLAVCVKDDTAALAVVVPAFADPIGDQQWGTDFSSVGSELWEIRQG